jgi:DNA-binding transcriptional ArsR family regulator
MPRKRADLQTPGRFSYDGLERAIHEKARLGILTSLITHESGLSFNDLKSLCSLTDGNLNRHLEALREAGLIETEREQSTGRAATICRITATGRKRFLEYLEELRRVVDDAASPAGSASLSNRLKPGLQP